MLKNRLKGYVIVEYKWVFLAKFIALCFCIAAGYVAVYALTDFSKPANAVEDEGVDEVKLVVMDWMKANSEMPEQVLSAIYDEAVKHPHGDPNYVSKVLKAMGEIYLAKMLDIPAEKGSG
ncbi:MAG: hypothetical protein M1443_00560 [Nitrospirae bacterium]|jgi:hypothetical protein|nr:hypothetical protein [Nitrospirota bacterium]